MSEKPLSDALGIDRSAEESLARAGVRTVEELRDANAESLAMASGIPVERVREWQQRARRVAGRRPARNPVVTGWLVAILGLAVALILGWALISIGAGRIKRAEQTQREAESRLHIALDFAAGEALQGVRDTRVLLRNQNWGEGRSHLNRVNELVTLMEEVAPEGKQQAVRDIRDTLGRLQSAVGEQSKGAGEILDGLEGQIYELRQEMAGG
jgi:hypothetical protein